jgi:acyl-CoA reductase-like NAD-dependent aldehyde dehydrogenase
MGLCNQFLFPSEGEVCTNATRVYVQQSILPAFQNLLLDELKNKLRIGDPLEEQTNVGATINEPHLLKIIAFLERAQKEANF